MIFKGTCAECGTDFETKRKSAKFCCRDHADQFMNRKKVRGATLLELEMHRQFGSHHRASLNMMLKSTVNMLLKQWREQDEAAGRRSMLDLDDVLERVKAPADATAASRSA